jgi:hypothetical protein
MIIHPLNFEVKRYQFNNLAPKHNYKTEMLLSSNPLIKRGDTKPAGLKFTWDVRILANDTEVVLFIAEDSYVLSNIDSEHLLRVIYSSYEKSSIEFSKRNMSNGLNAEFSAFETLPISLPDIIRLLET